MNVEKNEGRILGRELARELTVEEVMGVSGGVQEANDTVCDNGTACVLDDCGLIN